MIVDLPQFRSDLQKHKVENGKDIQQTKSQSVTKDGKLEAEKKTALESMASEGTKSWWQPGFKPPGPSGSSGSSGSSGPSGPPGLSGSSGPGGFTGEEGIVGILEPGATRPPVFDRSAAESDSKWTHQSPPGERPPQECLDKKESSPGGWPGQCTSKVVTSNFQVATLADLPPRHPATQVATFADLFTRELPETANCSQVEIN